MSDIISTSYPSFLVFLVAPVITEQTTLTLEGMIKQRILDQAWDDVQRKNKTKEEVTEFKKRVTLDQEKSKMSLGEIYEQEYIKQTQVGHGWMDGWMDEGRNGYQFKTNKDGWMDAWMNEGIDEWRPIHSLQGWVVG